MHQSMHDDIVEIQPLIQYAQKCPWCYQYLLASQKTELYTGNDIEYIKWIAHAVCNEINSSDKKYENKK